MNKKKIEGQTSTATLPKKPLSGFFIYRGQKFEEVKKQNASATIAELTKIISNQWNALDEKEKAKFTELSKKEREKYNIEMEKYVKENGPVEKVKRKKKKETTSGDTEERSAKKRKENSEKKDEEEGKAKKKVKASPEGEEKAKKKENSEGNKKKEAKEEKPKKETSVKAKKQKKEDGESK